MTESVSTTTGVGAPDRSAHRKLLAAGLFGSSIEWYDFFVYGTAAALVFPKVFFPDASALVGTLLAFSTFAIGFIARPLGGILAGHYGDKIGRKPMVLICLISMGLATFLIGCLPSAAAIGSAAPILLVALRFIQGLACGGQWGGIVLLLTESAGPKRRGFAGTFGQMGVPLGLVLGNLSMIVVNSLVSDAAFLSWGWRIPFWASAALIPVVLYIHFKVEDSPEFRALQAEAEAKRGDGEQVAQAPLSEAVRFHWRKIVLGAGLLAATNSAFYVAIAGFLAYATKSPDENGLGMDRNTVLTAVMAVSLIMPFAVMWAGKVSDRVGRRPLIILGGGVLLLWAFPFFWLANTTSGVLLFFAMLISSCGQSLTYGPLAAFMAELFEPRLRYSGASLGYQLAAVAVSGVAPLLMTWIIAETASTAGVSLYLAAMAVVTMYCAWRLPETNAEAVRNDPVAVPGLSAAA
ncbi:Sugar phosphate permease [Gordonia malaquae]|uniref:Putative major facilitator superfamily transporter n=1 Tax=Gordonia malaquae NBRC 108250 TaxID=1223542 RepID=M3VFP8_GORML|nr:MFS transporter [Gordonia malaquae]GAC80274.1 putative major facilitator superfamily transporter [Gordonia malaquae NBRC 108250]SEC57075.1 Sugar phosphate permease [Gordonia malaquae]